MIPQRNFNLCRRLNRSASDALAHGLYSAVRGKLSEKALDCLARGDYKQLVSLEINPSDYSDADEFRDDYFVAELMSKYPCWDTGIDKAAVALEKFLIAEQHCAEANLRLMGLEDVASTTTSCASYMYTARRKIEQLLGPFSWDQAAAHFSWGPGASTQVRSAEGDAYFKYGVENPEVTGNCAILAACAIAQSPIWYIQVAGLPPESSFCMPSPWLIARDHLSIVEGNRVVTVPKNAKTDRVIAIEPHMNMYVQKGIGALIRRRLLKVGVDLNDQTLNQRLAREASLTGLLATVDLSAASDSISLELCERLLPEDWLLAIKLARSPIGVMPDGTKIRYQKVSSMGNGFTFELESLIFWALVSSVLDYDPSASDRRTGVYGDDLIFPVGIYHSCVGLLAHCGFTVNPKKSFCYGWFRESCGKHYFNGFDVSPFYVREDVDSVDRLLWAANQIKRYASQMLPWGLDPRFYEVYQSLVRRLPAWMRHPSISDGYGDGALIGDFDEVRPPRAEGGLCGHIGRVFVPTPRRRRVTGRALLLKTLGSSPESWWVKHVPISVLKHAVDRRFIRGGSDTILSEGRSARTVDVLVPRWRNLGPWLVSH